MKCSYDYVILDTPPVGLVVDALQVTPFLDAMLYVVRYNNTWGELLEFIEEQHSKEVNNVSVIPTTKRRGHGWLRLRLWLWLRTATDTAMATAISDEEKVELRKLK